MTTKEIALIIGETIRTVERNMKPLQDKGIIERVGSDKSGYWKVNQ